MEKKAEIPGMRPFSKAHFLQSGLAALYIFLVFLAMDTLRSNLAVASLGASAFIAFSFPRTNSSRARFLIGGYCVGAAWGIAAGWLIRLMERQPDFAFSPHILGCGLAVFLTMLFMTALNFEHPPSCALTIAVATSPTPLMLALAAIVCMCILCAVKHLLRKKLVNL